MGEFGFTNPILLREDLTIGAGHGRLEAALQDPPLERVPTIIVPGLTPEQWRAYALADNKIALNAGWDEAALRRELEALSEIGFDLSLTGFTDDLPTFVVPDFQPIPDADVTPLDKRASKTTCPSCGHVF